MAAAIVTSSSQATGDPQYSIGLFCPLTPHERTQAVTTTVDGRLKLFHEVTAFCDAVESSRQHAHPSLDDVTNGLCGSAASWWQDGFSAEDRQALQAAGHEGLVVFIKALKVYYGAIERVQPPELALTPVSYTIKDAVKRVPIAYHVKKMNEKISQRYPKHPQFWHSLILATLEEPLRPLMRLSPAIDKRGNLYGRCYCTNTGRFHDEAQEQFGDSIEFTARRILKPTLESVVPFGTDLTLKFPFARLFPATSWDPAMLEDSPTMKLLKEIGSAPKIDFGPSTVVTTRFDTDNAVRPGRRKRQRHIQDGSEREAKKAKATVLCGRDGCNKKFMSEDAAERHRQQAPVHNPKEVACCVAECKKTFNTVLGRDAHMEDKHKKAKRKR